MTEDVLFPRMIFGPQAEGRDYGLLASSPQPPVDEAQIADLSIFNHTMVPHLPRVPVMYSLSPLRGHNGLWFLSISREQPAVRGNPVVVTSGILITSEQLGRLDGRADMLISPAVEERGANFAIGAISPLSARLPLNVQHGSPPALDLKSAASLIGLGPLFIQDTRAPLGAVETAERNLQLVASALAAAPFDRAVGMSWSTSAVPLASWAVAVVHAGLPVPAASESIPLLRIAEVDGKTTLELHCDPTLLRREQLWLAWLDAIASSPRGGRGHANSLDDMRHRATPGVDIAAQLSVRCLAFLGQIEDRFGTAGLLSWIILIVEAACSIPTAFDEQRVCRAAALGALQSFFAVEGVGPRASALLDPLIAELLGKGAESLLRRLGADPDTIGDMILATTNPLAMWPLLSLDEQSALSCRLDVQAIEDLVISPSTRYELLQPLVRGLTPDAAVPASTVTRIIALLNADYAAEDRPLHRSTAIDRRYVDVVDRLGMLAFNRRIDNDARNAIRFGADKLLDRLSDGAEVREIYNDAVAKGILAGIRVQDSMAIADAMLTWHRLIAQ
jgi:hypothetical protein